MAQSTDLFSEQLKYWRKKRGLSQLDLGLAANYSARHISFLETGKAKPTEQSLLLLAETLQIPFRVQNKLLLAAGFSPKFEDPPLEQLDKTPVGLAIEHMLENHHPYPMVVMDGTYNLVRANKSSEKIFQHFILEQAAMGARFNLLESIFDPKLCRSFVVDWEISARKMLSRLYRESLERSHDQGLQDLVSKILDYPDVPREWLKADFSTECEPTAGLILERDDLRFSFFMTMTSFNAPQNITVEELKIESYFPEDDETKRNCYSVLA